MKRLVIGGLSVLLMSAAIAPATMAQMRTENDGGMVNTQEDVLKQEAFELVRSAYRGEFEAQGISSSAQLAEDYRDGRVSPKDIVKAGIDTGRLSPQALNNEEYLSAVRRNLKILSELV